MKKTAFYKNIWWKLPLFFRPFAYFIYRYFILLGFLDGKEGAIFHLLQAFWFRLIVDIKMDELKKTASSVKSQSVGEIILVDQIKQ